MGAVAHACNPIYSGGRDQEDLSSKAAEQTVWDTFLGRVAQGVDPEFKPQYHKKKTPAFGIVI
jgi:hypothetical protein